MKGSRTAGHNIWQKCIRSGKQFYLGNILIMERPSRLMLSYQLKKSILKDGSLYFHKPLRSYFPGKLLKKPCGEPIKWQRCFNIKLRISEIILLKALFKKSQNIQSFHIRKK